MAEFYFFKQDYKCMKYKESDGILRDLLHSILKISHVKFLECEESLALLAYTFMIYRQ